jgi:hypothetical protein
MRYVCVVFFGTGFEILLSNNLKTFSHEKIKLQKRRGKVDVVRFA